MKRNLVTFNRENKQREENKKRTRFMKNYYKDCNLQELNNHELERLFSGEYNQEQIKIYKPINSQNSKIDKLLIIIILTIISILLTYFIQIYQSIYCKNKIVNEQVDQEVQMQQNNIQQDQNQKDNKQQKLKRINNDRFNNNSKKSIRKQNKIQRKTLLNQYAKKSLALYYQNDKQDNQIQEFVK